jgi:hypothetical protein
MDDVHNPLGHPFWQKVAHCWTNKMSKPFEEIDITTPTKRQRRDWTTEDRTNYRDQNRALFDCVAAASGAEIIVDSSHNRWRLLELEELGVVNLKVIYVIRDGRALLNSYSRKYKSLLVGFRRWFVPTLMGLLLRRRVRSPWIIVRYEDLARDPAGCLKRICEFAGLQFEPGMIRYWEHQDLSVGGNRMRWQKKPIRLDERWRRELPFKTRALFAVLGGWLNLLYGYPQLMGKRGTSIPEGRQEHE